MSTSDLSVKILQEIRDEMRESREESRQFREEQQARAAVVDQRFEVIETSLRDFAEQLVMLSRGMKVLLESRGESGGRLTALERRVDALEQKVS